MGVFITGATGFIGVPVVKETDDCGTPSPWFGAFK
jgi:nucleoside-diphosphate-sugar epimerase